MRKTSPRCSTRSARAPDRAAFPEAPRKPQDTFAPAVDRPPVCVFGVFRLSCGLPSRRTSCAGRAADGVEVSHGGTEARRRAGTGGFGLPADLPDRRASSTCVSSRERILSQRRGNHVFHSGRPGRMRDGPSCLSLSSSLPLLRALSLCLRASVREIRFKGCTHERACRADARVRTDLPSPDPSASLRLCEKDPESDGVRRGAGRPHDFLKRPLLQQLTPRRQACTRARPAARCDADSFEGCHLSQRSPIRMSQMDVGSGSRGRKSGTEVGGARSAGRSNEYSKFRRVSCFGSAASAPARQIGDQFSHHLCVM